MTYREATHLRIRKKRFADNKKFTCLNSVFSFALQNVSNQEVLPDAAAAQPDGQTSRPHQQFCLEPLKLHAPRHYKVGLLCFFFVFFD